MEFVYVVPRKELFPQSYPQGLVRFDDDNARASTARTIREHGFFVQRETAEHNPDWKQIIPYSILVRDEHVLLMRRLSRGGEKRLHDKLSIGVGGHINPEDIGTSGVSDPVEAGTRREVDEELRVQGTYEIRSIGLLNDDSNPVGAVHVGWVQVLHVKGSVEIREEDVLEGRLVTPGELREELSRGANFETWSSTLVRRLDEILPRTLQPHV